MTLRSHSLDQKARGKMFKFSHVDTPIHKNIT